MTDREKNRGACRLDIDGLHCADCARKLEESLGRVRGVTSVRVNTMTSRIDFEYDGEDVTGKVMESVASLGYSARINCPSDTVLIRIPEMDCNEEEEILRRKFSDVDGVSHLVFNLIKREVRFFFDGSVIGTEQIEKHIRETGMTALPVVGVDGSMEHAMSKSLKIALICGLFLAIAVSLLKFSAMKIHALVFFCLSMAVGGYPVLKRAFVSLKSRVVDMNLLMSVAVVGAVFLGDWIEAGVVVFLFSVAQLLETYSMERSRKAIAKLLNVAPRMAEVERNGQFLEVSPADVHSGEVVRVKPGGRIPLDGIIIDGSSFVNQAPITGEPIPVEKIAGDRVFAGTINEKGAFRFRVTHEFRETTLSRISEMVEEAQARKAPAERFVDRFARYYTPAVILIAALTVVIPVYLFGQPLNTWIYKALVLLMIACPCALVISTPVAVVSGLARSAHGGVLIRGGAHLETLAGIKVLALDKTGTITYGRPDVERIVSFGNGSESDILKLACAVESMSEHPIARAIMKEGEKRGLEIQEVMNFQSITGFGARGEVQGRRIFVGSHRFFEDKGACSMDVHRTLTEMEKGGTGIVCVGNDEGIIGAIVVVDRIRESAETAITELRAQGLKKILMLTGDISETAELIAKRLGIEYSAQLLPEDKLSAISAMEKEFGPVAMVGDGINDAPALARADVGMAMGVAGTDTALETADIALMADDLMKIPFALGLARRTVKTIRENVVIALGLKLIFLVLSILGLATLWMAVFADLGASLIVIFNGICLLSYREPGLSQK